VNDAIITVVGFVAAEPRYEVLASGTSLLSLRIGSTPRRYDRDLGQWRDEEPMFMTATCWRSLADNLQASELKRGDPVIVTGRLRIREYAKDGERRLSAQIDATTIGHDLSRGVARFQRTQRATANLPEERRQADDLADRWLETELEEGVDQEQHGEHGESVDQAGQDGETAERAAFRAVA
jgi:single-strand DNA-binding protein